MMIFGRYIDPTTDFGFKRIFGQEDSKEILKHFLFDILALPHPIENLNYLPTEQLPTTPVERSGIYDIYCVDTKGNRFIVEMQRNWMGHFKERAIYYATFPITQQVQKGAGQYFKLLPVYCVNVLGYRMDDEPNHIRRVQLADMDTCKLFYDRLTFVFIELPKFTRSLDELTTPTDKWLYLLKHMRELDDIPADFTNEPFTQMFTIAEQAALSPEDRMAYLQSFHAKLDQSEVMLSHIDKGHREGFEQGFGEGFEQGREQGVQRGREQGVQEGREQGVQEGREQGVQEGREQGVQEGREQGVQEGREQGIQEGRQESLRAMARQMLARGLERTLISEMTGLSSAEIDALIAEDT